jgi:hypothetical protein
MHTSGDCLVEGIGGPDKGRMGSDNPGNHG